MGAPCLIGEAFTATSSSTPAGRLADSSLCPHMTGESDVSESSLSLAQAGDLPGLRQ